MEGGKWEELNMDCLANVFGRVGIESLLLDVPFVCKSWNNATLNPMCWKRLIFPEMDPDPWCYGSFDTFVSRLMDENQVDGYFSITALIKSVVKRSCRSATLVSLPSSATEEALTCVANECPALKILSLPYGLSSNLVLKIPSLVNKWTHLETIRLGSSFNMQEIIAEISIHCKNFVELSVTGGNIGNDEASAIVTSVPNIKYLFLQYASLERENLVTILQGCKELVKLDVSDCDGFECDDEIVKLASNIPEFTCEGLRNKDIWYESEEDDVYTYCDVDFDSDDYSDFYYDDYPYFDYDDYYD